MNSKISFYPLLFTPIYQPVMWGGSQLENCPSRIVPKMMLPIGEAWEIVDRQDAKSVVTNGLFKGKTLSDLIHDFSLDLLGFQAPQFPLLIKVIDAQEQLSLQVHPSEESLSYLDEHAEPKTEMWYVLNAEENAKIYSGIVPNINKEAFFNSTLDSSIVDYLITDHGHAHDVYFIKGGRVHAIGGGTLIFEVQQNSNTTYRLSDWGRVDANGKSRQLHLESAKKCVDFLNTGSAKIENLPLDQVQILIDSPFFHVQRYPVNKSVSLSTFDSKTAHLVTAVDASIHVETTHGSVCIPYTQTALIPASCGDYTISAESSTVTLITRLVKPTF